MSRIKFPYVLADVFAQAPLSGNGVTVFFDWQETDVMQEISREMRQFESIFLKWDPDTGQIKVRIFTMDEELNFAGHPLLGAAAALHSLSETDRTHLTWNFQLKNGLALVSTMKNDESYLGVLDQGEPQFLNCLTREEASPFLNALNLTIDDLDEKTPLQVVTTGLPYLIIPVKQNLDSLRVVVSDLEKMLEKIGAKFTYVVDISSFEGRSWDNNGVFEDIATGSAAGPLGAYLVKYGYAEANTEITINQGRFLSRPSVMTVVIKEDQRGRQTAQVYGNIFLTAEGVVYLPPDIR